MMAHKIGSKVWHKGEEVVIASDAYVMCGGMFQNAVTESGDSVMVATPEQKEVSANRAQSEWKSMQADFSRLKTVSA